MENKSSQAIQTRTETLHRYHSMTSPLVPLLTAQQQDSLKHQLKHNASMRLECIKNRNSKVYALDSSSFSQLKAGAIIYQIPQFSSPEINFEVAEQIRKKVDDIKNEVITHLPDISKSSNYAPKKLEHQLNHRSAVRQLQEWLKGKLKQPPTSVEDTIDYKNMIMGVGMKELIRIIGKRCNEQGRIAQQIWQLTWGICRQIILYLSKRAKKCEQLLQEELKYMRISYQRQFQHLKQENEEMKAKVTSLQEQNKEYFTELTKLRKRRDLIEQQNKGLAYDNFHLQEEIKNILEENLAIYLQIGDKNKRGWVKKMYKNIVNSPTLPNSQIQGLYQTQIVETVEQRNKLEHITEELTEVLSKAEIEKIGEEIFKEFQRRKSLKEQKRMSRLENKKKKKALRKPRESIAGSLQSKEVRINTENINDVVIDEQVSSLFEGSDSSSDGEEEPMSKKTCTELIKNMRDQFKPIDKSVQTEKMLMIHAYASTPQVAYSEVAVEVFPQHLIVFDEIGVNTEEIKEDLKNIKRKGKQNSKDEGRQKSKLYTGPILSKDKLKHKTQKDKKTVLDIVHEVNREKLESKESQSQEVRISEQKSIISVVEPKIPTRGKSEEEKLSETGSVEMQWSRENESKPGRFTQDPQRNKMISFFKEESFHEETELVQSSSFPAPLNLPSEANQHKQNKLGTFKQAQAATLQQIRKSKGDVVGMKQSGLSLSKKSYEISQPAYQQLTVKKGPVDQSIKKSEILIMQTQTEVMPKPKIGRISKDIREMRPSYKSAPKQCLLYVCANCHKVIPEGQDKYSPIRNDRSSQRIVPTDHLRPPKRASEKMLYQNSLSSLKKLALASGEDVQDDGDSQLRKQFEGRRLKKMPTRRSSGYIHDIAFKKQIEGHLKSPLKGEEAAEKNQQSEQKTLTYKVNPAKWMTTQFQNLNKDFLSSIGYYQTQSGQNLQQYLQMVREVNTMLEGKTVMTDKTAVSTIEKGIIPILSQLLITVRKAVKTNKIGQTIKLFTSLPSIVFNRINRKYGVKILAVKHLKFLLSAFKVASRFTEKYKTIELMMFTDCKSAQSEDLFIYLLVMGLFDPNFTANKMLTLEQALTVRQICQEHLSKEVQVYNGEWWEKDREGQSIDMGELIRSIITNYRLMKISRIQELGFIYLMLKKDNWMQFKDFVTFLSTFKIEHGVKIAIARKLLKFCDLKSRDHKIGITENMFSKFLTTCGQLTLAMLQKTLAQQINESFGDMDLFAFIESKMFEAKSKAQKTISKHASRNDSIASMMEEQAKMTSTPQIVEEQKQSLMDEYRIIYRKVRIAHYLRHYSPFTYQICSFLENKEETKYLNSRQRTLIKQYLLMHVLETEVEQTIGMVDYFSSSMLGLLWTPANEFTIDKAKL